MTFGLEKNSNVIIITFGLKKAPNTDTFHAVFIDYGKEL